MNVNPNGCADADPEVCGTAVVAATREDDGAVDVDDGVTAFPIGKVTEPIEPAIGPLPPPPPPPPPEEHALVEKVVSMP